MLGMNFDLIRSVTLNFVRSETLTILQTYTGGEMHTVTGMIHFVRYPEVMTCVVFVSGYILQEMKFDWNTLFSMDYGTGPFTRFMHGLCSMSRYDTITCR